MLANNEPVQGLDIEDVFKRMLEELPWASLKLYVQANAPLLKLCTAGGHRLEVKQRKRIQKRILNEAGKAEFSQAFCNPVFAQWYPVHEELHKALEDYFNSDKYKALCKKEKRDEDAYVLPDAKLDELFRIEDLEKWRVLLCFSPMEFSEEQQKKVLDNSQGNTELLERIRTLEEANASLEKEQTRLGNDAKRFREQFDSANKEAQEYRKAERALRTGSAALEKKLDVALAENRKLRDQVAETGKQVGDVEKRVATDVRKASARLENEVGHLQEQLNSWQMMYETQRVENKDLEKAIEEARKSLRRAERKRKDAEMASARLHSFADLIIDKFDWPKVGQQMKMTPALQRQFNSLIKSLKYEEDRTLTMEGTLQEFWDRLMAKEKELVDQVIESNTREVMTGDVEDYWQGLTDAFEDVRISLEARTILIKMLHEIFYQVLEMGDLEKAKLP